MSLELTLLVWSVALAVVQMLIAFATATLEYGLPDIAGNREPPASSLAGRAQRASQNMLESLVPFTALMLAAELANRTNASTGLGAEVFFAARVVYSIISLAGLTWLRTAIWCVSIAALLLIFVQLL
jgi:uncharacterized MAPEG superfamily protein